MSIVKIKDKSFKTSIPEAEILKKVQVVADRLNKDYEGKTPVFLAVLNGAFIFAADLMRLITVPSEISFVKYASYEGTSSTGSMKTLMGLNQNLAGRHVVIVEDIVDSGFTMAHMIEDLKKMNPASVEVCSSYPKVRMRKKGSIKQLESITIKIGGHKMDALFFLGVVTVLFGIVFAVLLSPKGQKWVNKYS